MKKLFIAAFAALTLSVAAPQQAYAENIQNVKTETSQNGSTSYVHVIIKTSDGRTILVVVAINKNKAVISQQYTYKIEL